MKVQLWKERPPKNLVIKVSETYVEDSLRVRPNREKTGAKMIRRKKNTK